MKNVKQYIYFSIYLTVIGKHPAAAGARRYAKTVGEFDYGAAARFFARFKLLVVFEFCLSSCFGIRAAFFRAHCFAFSRSSPSSRRPTKDFAPRRSLAAAGHLINTVFDEVEGLIHKLPIE